MIIGILSRQYQNTAASDDSYTPQDPLAVVTDLTENSPNASIPIITDLDNTVN